MRSNVTSGVATACGLLAVAYANAMINAKKHTRTFAPLLFVGLFIPLLSIIVSVIPSQGNTFFFQGLNDGINDSFNDSFGQYYDVDNLSSIPSDVAAGNDPSHGPASPNESLANASSEGSPTSPLPPGAHNGDYLGINDTHGVYYDADNASGIAAINGTENPELETSIGWVNGHNDTLAGPSDAAIQANISSQNGANETKKGPNGDRWIAGNESIAEDNKTRGLNGKWKINGSELGINDSSGIYTSVEGLLENVTAPNATNETSNATISDAINDTINVSEYINASNVTTNITASNTTANRSGKGIYLRNSKGNRVYATAGIGEETKEEEIEELIGTVDGESSLDDGGEEAKRGVFAKRKITRQKRTMELNLNESPVKSIKFFGIIDRENASLGIEDATSITGEYKGKKWGKVYGIDPTEMEFEYAEVKSIATSNALFKCSTWDFNSSSCPNNDWRLVRSDLVPGQEYTITITPDDPGFGEANITIINVQSYPAVGGTWIVNFTTVGTANLTIRAVDGTTWSDSTESGVDLKFLELRCGNDIVPYQWISGAVFIENYSCLTNSFETSKVLTGGKHHLQFTFGDDVKYAHNKAGGIQVATGNFFLGTNVTGNLVINGLGFTPKAYIIFSTWNAAFDTNSTEGVGVGTMVSIGMSNGTHQFAMAAGTEDDSATDDNGRRGVNGSVILHINNSGGDQTFLGQARHVSMDSDGFTIGRFVCAPQHCSGFSQQPGNFMASFIAFGGPDLNASVELYRPETRTNKQYNDTRTGFEPDVIFSSFIGAFQNGTNLAINDFFPVSFGFAVNPEIQATNNQFNVMIHQDDGSAQPVSTGRFDNNRSVTSSNVGTEAGDEAYAGAVEITGWHDTGFNATTRNANISEKALVGYLALKLGPDRRVYSTQRTAETSAVSQTQGEVGFKPIFLMGLGTALVTTANTDTAGASVGISFTNGSNTTSIGIHVEDIPTGTQLTNTHTVLSQKFWSVPDKTGRINYSADFTSFNADGWTLNYDRGATSAWLQAFLAIGDSVEGPTNDCLLINRSGEYEMTRNITGADFSAAPYAGNACIKIVVSNVNFSCGGFNITDTTTTSTTYGIMVNGTYDFNYTNITINSCPGISNYTYGIYMNGTNTTKVFNTSLFNNSVGIAMNSSTEFSIISTFAFNNSADGFNLNNVTNFTFANNTAYNNTDEGIDIFAGTNGTFTNNTLYNNSDRGILVKASLNLSFFNNSAYQNTKDGIMLNLSHNITLVNNSFFGNLIGVNISLSNQTNMTGNIIYNNSYIGLSVVNSNNTRLLRDRLFANGRDFIVNMTSLGSLPFIINLSGVVFDNPAGDSRNFTNISVSDIVATGVSYSLNWSANPATLPATVPVSFRDKYINITNTSTGQISIDNITWHWSGSETTGYTESLLELWQYTNSSWVQMSNSPNTVANTFGLSVLNLQTSTFAILSQNIISNCTSVSSSGVYFLANNVAGTPIAATRLPGFTCIKLASSNVDFSCAGFSILNNETSATPSYGIVANGTSLNPYSNITIRNCPSISDYNFGIYLNFTNNSLITNVTIINNSIGISLNQSGNNIIANSNAFNHSTFGFSLTHSSNNNTVVNNTVVNTTGSGFSTTLSISNVFANDTSSNNSINGFLLTTSGNSSIFNSTSFNNSQKGISLATSGNNTVANSTVYNNVQDGIFLTGSANNLVINNTVYNSTNEGIEVSSSSFNNTIKANNASGNDLSGVSISSSENFIFDNIVYNNSDDGFSTSGGSINIVFGNNSAYNNTGDGFEITGQNHLLANNSGYNNTGFGFDIGTGSGGVNGNNTVISNTASGSTGASGFTSTAGNTFVNNTAFRNGFYGYYVNTGANNTFVNNTAFNNTDGGFWLATATAAAYYSHNNTYINNSAFNNTGSGFLLTTVRNGTYLNNIAYNNTLHGFFITNSNNSSFINNTVFNNSQNGFIIQATSFNNSFLNNTVFTNLQNGFKLTAGGNNSFINNTVYSNTHSGFMLTTAENNSFINNSAYLNFIGFNISYSNSTELRNNYIYRNSYIGLNTRDSNNTILSGDRFFNNGMDFAANVTNNAFQPILNLSGAVFDQPAGNLSNYTNISVSDIVAANYSINWSVRPASLPALAPISFLEKFINLTNFSPSRPQIDNITFHWLGSETTGFAESALEIWQYTNSSWTRMSNSPNTVANTLGINILDFTNGAFGILQSSSALTNCSIINDSGSYSLVNSVYGAPNNASPLLGGACIKIATPNVDFSCAGFTIEDNGTTTLYTSYGVLLNGSLNNITVRNCPMIRNYTNGLYVYQANSSFFENTTVFNNSYLGVVLNASHQNILKNITAYGTRGHGIMLHLNSSYNNITNSSSFNNTNNGLYVFTSSANNRIINATIYNNSNNGIQVHTDANNNFLHSIEVRNNTDDGIELNAANNNTFINITTFANSQRGFRVFSGSYNNFSNSSAYINRDGILADNAVNSTFFNVFSFSNSEEGFEIGAGYNNFTNCTTRRNGAGGFLLSGASTIGNFLVNNTAYEEGPDNSTSSDAGFRIEGSARFNTLINNSAYNNFKYGFRLTTSHNNTLDNNTAWNNTVGFGLFSSAENNTIANSLSYNNSRIGFNISNSNNTRISTSRTFGNGLDVLVNGSPSGGTAMHFNLTATVFDNPAGNLSNFTNISVSDVVEASMAYHLNWSTRPASLPVTSPSSFLEKHINITNISGAVSLDNVTWHWGANELTGYTEANFELWQYQNTTWTRLSNSPNTVANTLGLTALNPYTSVYSILQNGLTNCTIVSTSGEYNLANNVEGASVPAAPFSGNACIKIAVANVNFSCAGFNISNNGTADPTYGVLLNGTSDYGYSNITVRNCQQIQHYSSGVYMNNTNGGTVINNTLYNNTWGLMFNSSSNFTIVNNTVLNNTHTGMRLQVSSDNNITNNTVTNNSRNGIHLITSSRNGIIDGNTVSNHTASITSNIVLDSSNNVTIRNNNLTGVSVIQILSSSANFTILNNTIKTTTVAIVLSGSGTASGFVINNSINGSSGGVRGVAILSGYNNTFIGNIITHVGASAFRLIGGNNNYFFNNTVINATEGFNITDTATDYFLMNNSIYNVSRYGFTVGSSTSFGNNFSNNSVYNATIAGFFVQAGYNNTFINNTVLASGHGFAVSLSANNNTFINNTAYNNSRYGLHIENSNNTRVFGDRYFNNGIGVVVNNSGSVAYTVNLSAIIFDNPNGNLSNFTNLSVSDIGEASTVYYLNWSTRPASLPATAPNSFLEKHINITNYSGQVSIDNITWHWGANELTGYTEANFELWQYQNTTWTRLSNSPNTVANTLGLTALNPYTSVYSILQNGLTNCTIVSTSGEYNLANNVEGASVPAAPFSGSVCIKIAVSHVDLNCAGYNITNDGTADFTYGVLVNGTSDFGYSNISIKNCGLVSNYTFGVFLNSTNNSFVLNNTIRNSSMGIVINSTINTIVRDNYVFNNSAAGIQLFNSSNNTIANNSIYNRTGIAAIRHIFNLVNNRIEGNTIRGSPGTSVGVGIAITGGGGASGNFNAVVINNTISHESRGLYASGSTNCNSNIIANNTIMHTGSVGLTLENCNHNIVFNNTLFNITNICIASTSVSNNNTYIENNLSTCNLDGISLASATSNHKVFNNTIRNVGRNGLDVQSFSNNLTNNSIFNASTGINVSRNGNGNIFVNNSVINSSVNGIVVFGVYNNNFTNTLVYNSRRSGFLLIDNGSNSSFTNNIVYNNSIGFNITNSNYTNMTNNTIYNNSYIGVNIQDSNNTRLSGDKFYNNGRDFIANVTSNGFPYIVNLSAVIFDQPAGNLSNYTNVSLSDIIEQTTSYSFNWSARPASLPSGAPTSFLEKFLNITNTSGSVSLDNITFHWLESETTGYTEANFELWKYNDSGWTRISNSPNAAGNFLEALNINAFSVFAILQAMGGLTNCTVVTSAGQTNMTQNLTGAPNHAAPLAGFSCIRIAVSNAIFDCSGYNVTDNGTAGTTYGVLINGSLTNVTVRNCPGISNYSYGVYIFNSSNSIISNSTARNNSVSGFSINASMNISITSSNALNNSFFGVEINSSGVNFSSSVFCNNTVYDIQNLSNNAGQLHYATNNRCDSFQNWKELSTRNACTRSCSYIWERKFGNATGDIVLTDTGNGNTTQPAYRWNGNGTGINVYVYDADSSINWAKLQALGKTTLNTNSSFDFAELDSALNISQYYDNINSTFAYPNASIGRAMANFTVFQYRIENVSVNNSYWNSSFNTGIFWDTSDGGVEYDNVTKQDIVFAVKFNAAGVDPLGFFQYVVKVPANLSTYKSGTNQVTFTVELGSPS